MKTASFDFDEEFAPAEVGCAVFYEEIRLLHMGCDGGSHTAFSDTRVAVHSQMRQP